MEDERKNQLLLGEADRRAKLLEALGFSAAEPVSTGTTLIAVEYDGGVILGTDSRTSTGSYVASRATNKITPITDRICMLRAGSAADTQSIAEIVRYNVEIYSVMEGEPISVYRTAQMARKYLFDYRDQLMASMIIAGWDEQKGGQIYTIPLGGFISRQGFTASGSGSSYIQTMLDKNWRPGMTRDEVFKMVKEAAFYATYRDGSSGGVIRLADVSAEGKKEHLFRPDKEAEFPRVEAVPPAYQDHLAMLALSAATGGAK